MIQNIKSLICDEHQAFSLVEVQLPDLSPTEILVRNTHSGISIGTELALVRQKISWGPFPICPGYQALGIVEQIGSDVTNFNVGDKVYHRGCHVPFRMNNEQVSATTGAHSSHVIIGATHPLHGAALLPAGIDDAAASLFVMPSVALHGVNTAMVKVGDVVAVLGVGLVGLGVVATAKLRGAHVIAIDLDEKHLEMAHHLGAEHIIHSKYNDVLQSLEKITPGGADVVFESTGSPACVDIAMSLCNAKGKFIFQGNYGEAPLAFNFLVPHVKQVTAYFPCDDGYQPCREAVMDFMRTGALKWEDTITHRISPSEAPEFYDAMNQDKVKDIVGAVIEW